MANTVPLFANAASSKIATGGGTADGTGTAITLNDASRFPSPNNANGEYVPLSILDPNTSPPTVKEVVYMTARAGNALTIARAQEDAAAFPAAALLAGYLVEVTYTVASLAQLVSYMGGKPHVQEFTASGTFNVPAGVDSVLVTLAAGAGSGGMVVNTTNGSAAGGGGGAVLQRRVAVTPGAAIPVTIGAGGAAPSAASGAASAGINGNVGGDSTFGSLLTAKGGGYGAATASTTLVQGGDGGCGGGGAAGVAGGVLGGAGGGAGGSASQEVLTHDVSTIAAVNSANLTGAGKGSQGGNGGPVVSMVQNSIECVGVPIPGPPIDGLGGGGGGFGFGLEPVSGTARRTAGRGAGGGADALYSTATTATDATDATANTAGGGGAVHFTSSTGAKTGSAGGSGYCRVEWVA